MTKTTVILGAGASAEYGLPCGKALRDRILDPVMKRRLVKLRCDCDRSRNYDNPIYKQIMARPIEEFINNFDSSGTTSIDRFLKLRPEYKEIGQQAIAMSLINDEINAVQKTRLSRWML